VRERLQLLQQTMNKTFISSSSSAANDTDDAGSKKHLSAPGTLQSQTCADLPVKPIWMQEDTLLVYSPPGLRASDKVADQSQCFFVN